MKPIEKRKEGHRCAPHSAPCLERTPFVKCVTTTIAGLDVDQREIALRRPALHHIDDHLGQGSTAKEQGPILTTTDPWMRRKTTIFILRKRIEAIPPNSLHSKLCEISSWGMPNEVAEHLKGRHIGK